LKEKKMPACLLSSHVPVRAARRNQSHKHHARLATALIALCVSAAPAFADINGFNNGTNYSKNGYALAPDNNIGSTDLPTFSGNSLNITTINANSGAKSTFFTTKQNISSFTTSFVFQNINPTEDPLFGPADGFAFVVQNQGTDAVGGNASGLGLTTNDSAQPDLSSPQFSAIVPSYGIEFFLRNANGATVISPNGAGTFANATPTGLDLENGDHYLVTLTYNGPAFQLTESIIDQDDITQTYLLNRSADITDVVGNSAYVGFTGATGGATSAQIISNFTFTATPEPAALGLLACALPPLMRSRRRNAAR